MGIVFLIQETVAAEINKLFGLSLASSDIQVTETKPEFEGDYTVVLFSLTKQLKKSPEALGNEIGEALKNNPEGLFSAYNVIKGFLNLSVTDDFWLQFLTLNFADGSYGKQPNSGKK